MGCYDGGTMKLLRDDDRCLLLLGILLLLLGLLWPLIPFATLAEGPALREAPGQTTRSDSNHGREK